MTTKSKTVGALPHRLAILAAFAGALSIASVTASAGECPADQTGKNDLSSAATAPQGVTDTVLSSIELAQNPINLKDRLFRLRRLEVQPGGIVPLHNHSDRPALIYVISGTMTEYNSQCLVPVVHKAGEAARESIGLSHWWQNTGDSVAVLLSADLFHKESNDSHMM